MTVTPHVIAAVKHVPSEDAKPAVKFRIHVCAIAISGVIFWCLFHYHVGNELVMSFAPFAPNVIQETIDMVKRL